MRILLDHCVPKPFQREFPAHDVRTAAQMGWEHLQNGKLLAEAATSFEIFVTVDKNIKNEQNLKTLPIRVIVLDAIRNTPDVLAPFAVFVERALTALRPGQMIEIDATGAIVEIAAGPRPSV